MKTTWAAAVIGALLAYSFPAAATAEPEGANDSIAPVEPASTPNAAAQPSGLNEILPDLPEGANVVIYRAHAEPTIWASTVKVDGKKVAALGNKNWTAVRLEPGQHEVKIAWSVLSGQKGGEIGLDVVPGQTHFLEIVGQSRYAGSYGAGGMTFRMGSGIGEVSGPSAARKIASCCRFKRPAD